MGAESKGNEGAQTPRASLERAARSQPWGEAVESSQTVGGRPPVASVLGLFVDSSGVLLSFRSDLCNLNPNLLTQGLGGAGSTCKRLGEGGRPRLGASFHNVETRGCSELQALYLPVTVTQLFLHKDTGRSLPSGGSQVTNQPAGAEMVFLASGWSGSVQSNLRTNLKGDVGSEGPGMAQVPSSTEP